MEFAKEPVGLEEKLKLFTKLSTNHQVTLPGGRKVGRCRLGSFVNNLFNNQMILPTTGRYQQIGNALRHAEAYLRDNPEAPIYYATAMGAALEYREWLSLGEEPSSEQQMAALDEAQKDQA